MEWWGDIRIIEKIVVVVIYKLELMVRDVIIEVVLLMVKVIVVFWDNRGM